jgi:hypothetical protein
MRDIPSSIRTPSLHRPWAPDNAHLPPVALRPRRPAEGRNISSAQSPLTNATTSVDLAALAMSASVIRSGIRRSVS